MYIPLSYFSFWPNSWSVKFQNVITWSFCVQSLEELPKYRQGTPGTNNSGVSSILISSSAEDKIIFSFQPSLLVEESNQGRCIIGTCLPELFIINSTSDFGCLFSSVDYNSSCLLTVRISGTCLCMSLNTGLGS